MTHVVDLDNPRERNLLMEHLRSLAGKQRVEIVRYRPRRSDRANRFYWPAIVMPFAEWLTENYGETVDADDAHAILKRTLLTRKVKNLHTGKVMEIVGHSSTLTDVEFSEFVDKCIRLLNDYCGIQVQCK